MTAPMTAAEYRMIHGGEIRTVGGRRLLAALEEREALLEQAKFGSADASVGALVRRIREEKPFAYLTWSGSPVCFALDKNGLTFALDSLLPKEPEVAPSGWTYERADKFVRQIDHEGGTLVVRRADSDAVPPCDREFVAKLMEASRGN